jgi:hypothetical protein
MHTTLTCPVTGAVLNFDLPGDEATLPRYWATQLDVHCPLCGQVHAMPYRRAYVISVMSRFRCIPADVRESRLPH